MIPEVTYRDEDHTYWCRGERYLSATQVIELFKQEFDKEQIAVYMESRYGAASEIWKERWDDIRETSLVRGNKIHHREEEGTLSRGLEVHQGKVLPVPNPALFPEKTPLIQMPDGVYTEQLLYHHGYRIAGRCDKVIITTERGIRYADVDDYKSNKAIKARSFQYKDGTRQMMKPPLSHLEDCSMVHYTLQLSEYFLMLEHMGFVARRGRLIHYPHIPSMAPPGATAPPPVIYPVQYRKDDVISMLQQLTHG